MVDGVMANSQVVADMENDGSAGLEAALAARQSRELFIHDPIQYDFTHDRGLLHQYFHVREVMYRKVFNSEKFIGKEDVYDKLSHILIARQGRLCVGGCRITVREPDEDFLMPMESSEFNLREMLVDKDQFNYRHCEVSRFAILSDKYEKEVMYTLIQKMFEKLLELEVKHLYIKATYPMYRNWRRIANSLGFHDITLFKETELSVPENPIHPGVKWYVARVALPVPTAKPAKVFESVGVLVPQ